MRRCMNGLLPKPDHFCNMFASKKLSFRRGTARRAVSVETVLNVAQMFVE